MGLADDFLSSATKLWGEQGLTTVGRALQKHAGRDGSVFQEIKFSHKTANQDGLSILNQIMNSKNQVIQTAENGSKLIFDKTTGRGFGVSREGLFNGFRELPK
jgi:filamentous hemagglutinin